MGRITSRGQHTLRILIIILLTVMLLVIIHFTLYSPLRSNHNDLMIFRDIISVTVPNSTSTDLANASHAKPFGFSQQSFQIYNNRFYTPNSTPAFMEGTFYYRFGEPKVNFSASSSPIEGWTQAYFTDTDQAKSTGLWEQLSIQNGEYYVMWFGLKKPCSLGALVDQYPDFYLAETENRILSTAIRTSQNEQDITLYTPGNGTDYHQMVSMKSTEKQYVSYLYESLKNIVLHENIADKYMESGLFAPSIRIDFKERLQYIQEHGTNGIGFIAYVQADKIDRLKKDDNLCLLHVEKAH